MNLGELNAELALIVSDPSLESYFTGWVNNAVLEIANDFSLPALRLNEPETVSTTTSTWLYDVPTDYMREVFKCYDENWNKVTIKRSLDDIDSLDIDHDDTGDNVTHIAVRDRIIGIYPKAADTLRLWYYKKPTDLALDATELTCIPEQYHMRVVIPKVVIKNWELLQDMAVNPPHKSLEYWRGKYNAGLFGDGSDIGMINCFAREKKPKRHGGADPIP